MLTTGNFWVKVKRTIKGFRVVLEKHMVFSAHYGFDVNIQKQHL